MYDCIINIEPGWHGGKMSRDSSYGRYFDFRFGFNNWYYVTKEDKYI